MSCLLLLLSGDVLPSNGITTHPFSSIRESSSSFFLSPSFSPFPLPYTPAFYPPHFRSRWFLYVHLLERQSDPKDRRPDRYVRGRLGYISAVTSCSGLLQTIQTRDQLANDHSKIVIMYYASTTISSFKFGAGCNSSLRPLYPFEVFSDGLMPDNI
jgi:hypothetical protein